VADPALIITDGGLPSLLALCVETARQATPDGQPAAWFALTPGQSDERPWRAKAARHAAEVMRTGELIEWTGSDSLIGLTLTRAWTSLLLSAGAVAIEARISRVVWPIQIGSPISGSEAERDATLSAIVAVTDRAVAVSRLLALDAGDEGLRIETPWVDQSLDQLADLAGDLDAPLNGCWLGRPGTPERDHWERALLNAGVEPPASGAPNPATLTAARVWTTTRRG